MKKCTGCGAEVEDNVETCGECGSTEFRALVGPEVQEDAGGVPQIGDIIDQAEAQEPQAPVPAVLVPPIARNDRRRQGQPPPVNGRALAHAPLEPEPAAAEAPDAAVEPPEPQIAPAPVVVEINTSAQLDAIKNEGLFMMGLLGFPTGGKTWFLNRLKYTYQRPPPNSRLKQRKPCVPTPPAARNGSVVPRTNDILRHQFIVSGRPDDSFNLLDVPGERFRTAASSNFVGVTDLTLAALRVSDAIVIVLPADEILFAERIASRDRRRVLRALQDGRNDPAAAKVGLPPDDNLSADDIQAQLIEALAAQRKAKGPARERLKREIERLRGDVEDRREWRLAEAANDVEDFIDNIGLLAGVLSLLESGVSAEQVAAMSGPEIMGRVGREGFLKRRAPVFLAISKMDSVLNPDPFLERKLDEIGIGPAERARLDADPLGTLKIHCPGLEHHAFAAFEWCKVDCITAFEGHLGGDTIDYDCPAYGVEAVVEWIRWAKAFAKGPPWAKWEARAAQGLRYVRDLGVG